MKTAIIARIYDTDGGQDWTGLPAPRANEELSDYAFRLQKWARREVIANADSYGDCDHVRAVDEPHEAHVVIRAETEEEFIEYYLCATVEKVIIGAEWECSF